MGIEEIPDMGVLGFTNNWELRFKRVTCSKKLIIANFYKFFKIICFTSLQNTWRQVFTHKSIICVKYGNMESYILSLYNIIYKITYNFIFNIDWSELYYYIWLFIYFN